MNKTVCYTACATLASILLTGCDTNRRSISDSGYPTYPNHYVDSSPRELNEFDVLGIEPDRSVSEEEIAQAGARAQRVVLSRNSTILVVQSGATYPDGPMLAALRKDFDVVPFNGVNLASEQTPASAVSGTTVINPSGNRGPVVMGQRYETRKPGSSATHYSRLLRLAAARAGADTIVCYWGILESSSEHLPTKTVSWIPVATWVVPDEVQHMRIRVKAAVIDVKTGNWRMFSPEPFEDKSWSVSPRREVVDQKQVESLKSKAYASCAKGLVEQFAN